MDYYSVSSLKQQSTDRHVAPLGHIYWLPTSQSLLFLLNTSCLAEKQQNLCHFLVFGLTRSGGKDANHYTTETFHLLILITPVVSSNLRFTDSDYPFGIFKPSIYWFWLPLWYLQTFDLLILITPLVSSNLPFTDSDYPFGIFKLSIYWFWLLLWYLQTILFYGINL
jgi:hypothetical protein